MRTIQITTASRLHFGLLAPSAGHSRRFGGVGVMVHSPTVQLSVAAADRFRVAGPGAERAREFAERWASARELDQMPPCQLVIESLPRMHTGLGVGSQLGLAVARILNEWLEFPAVTPTELAASVGRGQRSAVGTYGFFYGGLVAETGKQGDETLAPLACRVDLPESWRWLLVTPRDLDGLSGPREQAAFAEMREPQAERARQLSAEIDERLLPAARRRDFAALSASLYRFGYQAGLSFAAVQGGPYNGPLLEQLVQRIRDLGVEGVGQSSWGPTIFALCPDEATASSIAGSLHTAISHCDTTITATCNHGAQVRKTA